MADVRTDKYGLQSISETPIRCSPAAAYTGAQIGDAVVWSDEGNYTVALAANDGGWEGIVTAVIPVSKTDSTVQAVMVQVYGYLTNETNPKFKKATHKVILPYVGTVPALLSHVQIGNATATAWEADADKTWAEGKVIAQYTDQGTIAVLI